MFKSAVLQQQTTRQERIIQCWAHFNPSVMQPLRIQALVRETENETLYLPVKVHFFVWLNVAYVIMLGSTLGSPCTSAAIRSLAAAARSSADCKPVGQAKQLVTELSHLALPPKGLKWAAWMQLAVL